MKRNKSIGLLPLRSGSRASASRSGIRNFRDVDLAAGIPELLGLALHGRLRFGPDVLGYPHGTVAGSAHRAEVCAPRICPSSLGKQGLDDVFALRKWQRSGSKRRGSGSRSGGRPKGNRSRPPRCRWGALTIIAVMASVLLLSAAGIHALTVSPRRREIGIRSGLGVPPGSRSGGASSIGPLCSSVRARSRG